MTQTITRTQTEPETFTATKPKTRCPVGYTELVAGVTREIRVNQNWLKGYGGAPFLIFAEGRLPGNYAEVLFAEPPHMACGETTEGVGCGQYTKRTACVSTQGALYVK